MLELVLTVTAVLPTDPPVPCQAGVTPGMLSTGLQLPDLTTIPLRLTLDALSTLRPGSPNTEVPLEPGKMTVVEKQHSVHTFGSCKIRTSHLTLDGV